MMPKSTVEVFKSDLHNGRAHSDAMQYRYDLANGMAAALPSNTSGLANGLQFWQCLCPGSSWRDVAP